MFPQMCPLPEKVAVVPPAEVQAEVIEVGWRFWFKDRKDLKASNRVAFVYDAAHLVPPALVGDERVFVRMAGEEQYQHHGRALVYLQQFHRPGDELCGVVMYQ